MDGENADHEACAYVRTCAGTYRFIHLARAGHIHPDLEAFQDVAGAAPFSVLNAAAHAEKESPEAAAAEVQECKSAYLIHCIPGLSKVQRLPRESAWRPWPRTM